jgi:hypothetical protein
MTGVRYLPLDIGFEHWTLDIQVLSPFSDESIALMFPDALIPPEH